MKPLPAKLVRSGHCVHVPALGSSSDDANLVNALLEDIENLISDMEVKLKSKLRVTFSVNPVR